MVSPHGWFHDHSPENMILYTAIHSLAQIARAAEEVKKSSIKKA